MCIKLSDGSGEARASSLKVSLPHASQASSLHPGMSAEHLKRDRWRNRNLRWRQRTRAKMATRRFSRGSGIVSDETLALGNEKCQCRYDHSGGSRVGARDGRAFSTMVVETTKSTTPGLEWPHRNTPCHAGRDLPHSLGRSSEGPWRESPFNLHVVIEVIHTERVMFRLLHR